MVNVAVLPMQGVRFDSGHVTVSESAIVAIEFAYEDTIALLTRHLVCDWSGLDESERVANEAALRMGCSILSVYTLSDGTKVCIETDASRSTTHIYLEEEY